MISGNSCCNSQLINLFFSNRDESIKKLLEMLQSKGLSSRATEEDHERTRRLADAEMTIHQLEGFLEQKDKEMLQLREVGNKMHSSIPMCVWVCVCLRVQPDVMMCKSNHVIPRHGSWLLPLLAHNSVLIQHRNIVKIQRQTHKNAGRNTLSHFVHNHLLAWSPFQALSQLFQLFIYEVFVVAYNSSL